MFVPQVESTLGNVDETVFFYDAMQAFANRDMLDHLQVLDAQARKLWDALLEFGSLRKHPVASLAQLCIRAISFPNSLPLLDSARHPIFASVLCA